VSLEAALEFVRWPLRFCFPYTFTRLIRGRYGDSCETNHCRPPTPYGSQINSILAYLFLRTGTGDRRKTFGIWETRCPCSPPRASICSVHTPCHLPVKRTGTVGFSPCFFSPHVNPYGHHRSSPARRSATALSALLGLGACFTMGQLLPTLQLIFRAFHAVTAYASFPSFAEP
jgi:hypothetical protein